MNRDCGAQSVLFPELSSKPILAEFDQSAASSDGGALLLKAADEELGLTQKLADCLSDTRQTGKVRHSVLEALRQRVFGIALGYPDANDAGALADDPIHKLLLDRDPVEGDSLASQSTLSRFENGVRGVDVYRMGVALADTVIGRHKRRLGRRAKRIILDFDPTDDPTYGQQEFTFFHGYYDHYCYLPLVGTIQFNREKKQHLLCSVLRPGNAPAHEGFVAIASRLITRLRAVFPKARICIRLDGGFGAPAVLDFLDAEGVEYVVGLANTKPLKRKARREMAAARQGFKASGCSEQVYGETLHQTKTSWPSPRRVIYKAEVVAYPNREPKDNLRFVVTNLRIRPKSVYRFYCQRGDAENRIKELKNGLGMDRTSCTRFLANQFRVLLTATAYVLMQELQMKARHSRLANAQVSTLRDQLLKLAAWVEVSVRRVVVHLPSSFPGKLSWERIAGSAGGLRA